jgi:hypothetical protein
MENPSARAGSSLFSSFISAEDKILKLLCDWREATWSNDATYAVVEMVENEDGGIFIFLKS